MPPSNLPEGAKKIYVAAEKAARTGTCKDAGDRMDECVNKVAWGAVKKKYKKVEDSWVRKEKADLKEFSLAITKASYNKETQTMRWRAVASDTFEDLYHDEMSMELFSDFIDRIGTKEKPPEHLCSEFWCGGIPYLSLSHYPDVNGRAVPGAVDKVFIDGNRLKSFGSFDNSPLGKACFDAICTDLYGEEERSDADKVRVSIAFIDWKHKHKSNGYIFDRKSLNDICPECLLELITEDEPKGKVFLAGHLVHLALTRVPVNVRTEMEVERSMAITRKEDAASIVGDELADEIEEALEEVESVDKSQAIVVKSEEEEVLEDDSPEEDVTVDEEEISEEVEEETPEVEDKSVAEPHVLDEILEQFKASYDEVDKTDPQAALEMLQEPFNVLSTSIVGIVKSAPKEEVSDGQEDLIAMLSKVIDAKLEPIVNQLSLVQVQLSESGKPSLPENYIPKPRSFQPTLEQQQSLTKQPLKKSSTPKLRMLAERSVGLNR